jgi:hypothetical protein
MTYGIYHIRTSKAGSHYYTQPREKGVVRVWYDSKLYEYHIPCAKGQHRKIRCWVEQVFCEVKDYRVTGKYPNYFVES